MTSEALRRIRELVGPSGWLDEPAAMAPFLQESRGLFRHCAPAVVSPADTAQVAAVLAICHDAGLPVIPQGGNTGRCGGAVPSRDHEGIVLSLRRLARIRAVDPDNYTLTAEAGCILADIQCAAAAVDRLFPLSLGAEGSCQIGGNLASNAGGLNVLRYGNARELTLGLEVVLADGRVWDGLSGLRKNNTGYDLRDLFIGSEGTLGIITAATLKLFPRPQGRSTALLALGELDHCVALLALARAVSGDAVTSFELLPRLALEFACRHIPGCRAPLPHPHDWYVLIELVGHAQPVQPLLESLLEQAHARGLIVDAVTAASQAQADALWRLREAAVEAQRFEGASIKHDISVPVAQVPAFIRAASRVAAAMIPGVRVYAFGHVGDGNVHYNLSQPEDWEAAAFMARREDLNRAVHDVAMAMGGSFSAEHGIGQLKLGEMARYKSPVELQLMYALKQALDPRGILNPGKVLPPLAGHARGE